MKKKVMAFALAIMITAGLSTSALANNAYKNSNLGNITYAYGEDEVVRESRRLVEEALKERKFYKYNIAYASVNRIKDEYVKGELLGKLASISEIVFTSDIKRYISMLENLVQSGGSGKIYDEIEAEFRNSALDDFDEGYLLGELTSWGRKLVYTPDYQYAVDRVVDAWNLLSNGTDSSINSAILQADKAIAAIKNRQSKEYLNSQLEQIRQKMEFGVIEIY